MTLFLGNMSKYPNLAKLLQGLWKDASVNGKIYGIPNATGVISDALPLTKRKGVHREVESEKHSFDPVS